MGVLVDNACKYAGIGGYVRLRVRGNGNRVLLQVDDTGPGIPLRTDRSSSTGSTGAPTNPEASASAWPLPTRWSGHPAGRGR